MTKDEKGQALGGKWEIEPQGVANVLREVDDAGELISTTSSDFASTVSSGGGQLTAGGRTVLQTAWETYTNDRSEVPGKLMAALFNRASQVSAAVMDINTGAVEMSDNFDQNQTTAEELWDLTSNSSHFNDQVGGQNDATDPTPIPQPSTPSPSPGPSPTEPPMSVTPPGAY